MRPLINSIPTNSQASPTVPLPVPSQRPEETPHPERDEQYVDHEEALRKILRYQSSQESGRWERLPHSTHVLLHNGMSHLREVEPTKRHLQASHAITPRHEVCPEAIAAPTAHTDHNQHRT